jgi:hypothetical protein
MKQIFKTNYFLNIQICSMFFIALGKLNGAMG